MHDDDETEPDDSDLDDSDLDDSDLDDSDLDDGKPPEFDGTYGDGEIHVEHRPCKVAVAVAMDVIGVFAHTRKYRALTANEQTLYDAAIARLQAALDRPDIDD